MALSLGLAVLGCQPTTEAEGAMSSDSDAGGKADLPNDEVEEHEIDTLGYRTIAQHFIEAGYDLDADPSALDPIWPLDDPQTVLLSRFGTPVQNAAAGFGWYMHDAADIARSSPDVDRMVRAPVSGYAKAFDWGGGRPDPFLAYSSVVAIYNPESRVLVQLMHVSATSPIRYSGFEFVEQGQVIGRMADAPGVAPEHADAYVHTHLTMVDGESLQMFDPLPYLPYRDDTAPDVLDLYVLDEDARRHDGLVDGEIDVILEVADLDEDSNRNFEAAAIAYEIRDDNGEVLARSERCDFRTLLADIRDDIEPPVADLLDFGNAAHQIGPGGWSHNDQGYAENTYRYALTQFQADADGMCHVVADADGAVRVDTDVRELEVVARLWDPSGNTRDWSGSLARRDE